MRLWSALHSCLAKRFHVRGKRRRWTGLRQDLSVEGSQIAKVPVVMRVADVEDLHLSTLMRFGLWTRRKIGHGKKRVQEEYRP